MQSARLIIDEPLSGARNMSLDEALLESLREVGQSTLRFYRWTPATLSLGYFQKADDRRLHEASRDCPITRRSSGGGAIVHDRELTYSLVVPAEGGLAMKTVGLYAALHDTLIDVLKTWGVAAQYVGDGCEKKSAESPFLCFERRSCQDVIVNGMKICGSAQRRRNGAVLQHGSVLLAQSAAAPELPGIAELANVQIPPAELAERWAVRLGEKLGFALDRGTFTGIELERANRWSTGKFGNSKWIERR
jgi:lipoate-protein ligase A